MTREEAIKWFEWNVTSITVPEAQEAFRLAIAALKEQEERSSKRISTPEELKSYQGRCVSWNGEICSCKNGYLASDNGTFSFDWVLSHGEVYSCPMCGRRLGEA